MNKRMRKLICATLAVGMISSYSIPIFADTSVYGKDVMELGEKSDITDKEKEDESEKVLLEKTPKLTDSLSSKTARIDKKIIHYIDGMNFENHEKSGVLKKTTGILNLMYTIYPWELYDRAAHLDEIVVPWIDLEINQDEGRFTEVSGVRVTLVGFSGLFNFTIEKDFSYSSDKKEDITFTREEMQLAAGVDLDTVDLPREISINYTPIKKMV